MINLNFELGEILDFDQRSSYIKPKITTQDNSDK